MDPFIVYEDCEVIMELSKEIKAYLRKIGKKGGEVTKKRGKKYYSVIGKKGNKSRKKKK